MGAAAESLSQKLSYSPAVVEWVDRDGIEKGREAGLADRAGTSLILVAPWISGQMVK